MILNCTDVNGTLVRITYVTKETPQTTTADDNTDDEYDQTGAMHFIVATILVYSILGVFCVLINRIKRLSGQSHANYVHDESIQKYLKNEKTLKVDGKRLKLQYECELVAEKLKWYNERQKLLDLEKELTSDFLKESYSEGRKKRKTRKKKRDIGSTLGKMGASLLFIGTDPSQVINENKLPDDSGAVADGKYEGDNVPEDWKAGVSPLGHKNHVTHAAHEDIAFVDTENETDQNFSLS